EQLIPAVAWAYGVLAADGAVHALEASVERKQRGDNAHRAFGVWAAVRATRGTYHVPDPGGKRAAVGSVALAALVVSAIDMTGNSGLLSRYHDTKRDRTFALEPALKVDRSRLRR
ncbi:MAG: hypothetical protein C0521_17075, partial [Xanthomonas sp.]|nr:hypothetical protein [Xanthomonas sp.]